jgi:hypothetical protein
MNKQRTIMLTCSIVVLGLLIPIVPRLVVPLIWPYPYDDPFFAADTARIGVLLAWNALPFALLALGAYIALTQRDAAGRRQATVLGGVLGALIIGLVAGLGIHTPNVNTVGFNFGVAFFPLYMLVLMPVGFGLGALLVWYRATRTVRRYVSRMAPPGSATEERE